MAFKLLVVDDEQDIRGTISLVLQKHFKVLEASGGQQALRLVQQERPNMMLLDISMPDMSGLEVLKAVREIDSSLLIIMLTSETDIEVARRSLELGADEYITKPFDVTFLCEEVRRLMPIAVKGSQNKENPPWRVRP